MTGSNYEKIRAAVSEITEATGEPPHKAKLVEELDVSERTVERQGKRLRQDGELIILTDEQGRNRYAPPTFDASEIEGYTPIRDEVQEELRTLRKILVGEPTVKEISREIGRDHKDALIRTVVIDAATERGWREPEDDALHARNEKLERVIKAAVALREDWEYSPDYPEEGTRQREDAEEYLEDNSAFFGEGGFEIDKRPQGNRVVVHVPETLRSIFPDGLEMRSGADPDDIVV